MITSFHSISNKKVLAAIVLTAVAFSFILLLVPEMTHAAPSDVPRSTSDITSRSLDSTVGNIIRKIVNFIALIAGVIFVGMLIRDGIKLAGSSGNPHARSEAIRGIMFSLIGCLVAIGAPILIGVVIGML